MRFWSSSREEIVVRDLGSLFFGHAKAKTVLDAMLSFFKELEVPTQNLFCISSDGPNVNKSIWEFLNNHLKSQGIPGLVEFVPCNLHVVHNAFRVGLKQYGQDVEQFCISLFYWFRNLPCRREDFQAILLDLDLEENFFVQHGQTRWVTLGRSIQRIIVNF